MRTFTPATTIRPIPRPARLQHLIALLFVLALSLAGAANAGHGRYMEADEFLQMAFAGQRPDAATLWIDESLRTAIEDLLGHPFDVLRVRYWQYGEKSAWIFDEVGKEQPITIGVSVVAGTVDVVRVLEFRETRGWEVRHPFFTDQFAGARVVGEHDFDRSIDGITGATLSVAAVTRVVKLALLLSAQAVPYPT